MTILPEIELKTDVMEVLNANKKKKKSQWDVYVWIRLFFLIVEN